MGKPKKLIRKNITEKLKVSEWELIEDQTELNGLYALKVQEELKEIQESDYKDIMEFVDLIQVAFSFAKQNGFTHEELAKAMAEKSIEKGTFSNIALNSLNPNNPSNALYFPDSHSPTEPVYEFDTLQDGDWFQGTKKQYRQVVELENDGSNYQIKYQVEQFLLTGWCVCLDNTLMWGSGNFNKTKLTASEFIRRAENTFKTSEHE